MAFEPIFEVARLDCRRRLCSSQAVVEARLIPAPNVVIARVLSISCDSSISASETFAGEARYNGRVNFKVLFVDVEGVNHSMDYNADFSDKITCDAIVTGLKPIFSSSILDTDTVSVNSGEIKLASVVEVYLDAIINESVKHLAKGGDNIYTHDDRLDYSRLVVECGDTFVLMETLKDVKISKVLLAESKIVIDKRTSNIDSVVIEGQAIADLCCETEDGLIASFQTVTPFVHEMQAVGSRSDQLVISGGKINSFKTSFEADGEKSNIAIEFNVAVIAQVFTDETCNPIVDAFSVTNEILSTGLSVCINRMKLCSTFKDRVEGSITLDVNMPIVDNILSCNSSCLNLSNAYATDGKVVLEGIVSSNIIYYCAEGNSKNSVSVELPFSLTFAANVSEGDNVNACGTVTQVNVKIRRGNELDIKADISVELYACGNETKYVITELKLGEARELPTSAFSIHIARKAETLWDIAKSLNTTPELVLLQNPNLTMPLSGGERVIAYRHLTK